VLFQVPLFLAINLPFIFCRHGYSHDEAFRPLIVRLVGPSWLKIIWALSFVSKSLPRRGIGHSGKYRNFWVTMCPPSWHVCSWQNCWKVWVLVVPTSVGLHWASGATGLMMMECSAPESNHEDH
jgi:hypothetical protein